MFFLKICDYLGMTSVNKRSDFYKTIIGASCVCAAFAVAAASVVLFMPRNDISQNEIAFIEAQDIPQILVETPLNEEVDSRAQNVSWLAEKDSFNTIKIESDNGKDSSADKGLELYRNPLTRVAVEWFYLRVTGNRDVTMAILDAANREDIPLSLAFALCYAESRFNRAARNINVNGSIDRGLFQLNDRSFPHLVDEDFYNPETSAKFGMSHLRYCLSVADNETTAVAMYNAGISRVRSDKTPASTLRYVGRIASYRANLESRFAEEVLSHYIQNEQQVLPVMAR